MKATLRAFIEFQKLFIKHKVKYYKAVATSALRDAKNSHELIDLIYSTSHIQLDLIDGKEEARLVHLGVSHVENISKKNALLVDIGGGSVEFIISVKGQIKKFFSLPMGTVRLLNKANSYKPIEIKKFLRTEIRKRTEPLKAYVKLFQCEDRNKVLIGTGGNVKSLNKLSSDIFKNSQKDQMSFKEIDFLEKILFGYTMKERIMLLGLKPDRADVILPAVLILKEIMMLFNFKEIRAPNIALKDGILIQLSK
jgi:exopolyphosphatase/guanosine-5'-triphosphate,3'-diphosphate pyrophosphatase